MLVKTNGYLERYYKDCKSRIHVVGDELMTELEHLIKDIESEEFIYDTTKADQRIDFMTNCIKLTKSPFYGQPMKLMDFQLAFISALYGFKMLDGTDRFQRALFLISRKNGKALALDTRIPTPEGDKTIADIEAGDYVYSELGEPIKVLATSDIFYNHDCYEVKFEDGEKIIADGNHKWVVVDDNKLINLTTKDLKEYQKIPTKNYFIFSSTEHIKEITSIKQVDSVPTKCICVDNPRGLFLCGNRNTVTHNSELSSALALTELIIGGKGMDIVCSSNDDNQASILTDAIDTMRIMIDPDSKDTWRNQKGIKCLVNDNKIFKLSERTRNKEGRNIDMAVVDECYTGETEILTASGFKRFDQLRETDKVAEWEDGYFEFIHPTRIIKRKCTEGLVRNNLGHGRGLYTTPNHNIVYQTKQGLIKTIKASKSFSDGFVPLSGIYKGGSKEHLSNYERMLIATQADGSLHYIQSQQKPTNNTRVCNGVMYLISFCKERKIQRFLEISKGLDVKEIKGKNGYRRFTYILKTDKAKQLYNCFKLEEMTSNYAKEFIEEIVHWDGYKDTYGRIYYSSTDKRNTDFVTAVGTLAGYTILCTEMKDERKETYNTCYRVILSSNNHKLSSITFSKYKEFIDYSDDVYCVEVPTHKIVIRSDGKVLVCGNCHEQKDGVIIKSIEQSQSLKLNPKLILISTEGFVNGGTLDQELIRARGILRGEIQDSASKRFLIWLYTQDAESEVWNGNEENRLWEKSNPTLGTIKRYSYLEQQVDLAKTSKVDRAFVLAKDFNIKQSNSESWLLREDWDYEEVFDIDDFKGSLYLGAVDIAETTDLSCAKILLMKPHDSKKYIYTQYFIPEGKLEKSDDSTAGAKYLDWAGRGMITICQGNYTDVSIVADWFYKLYQDYGLRPYAVGYDVKFATDFLKRMDMYGFETELIYQRPEILNGAIKMTEADLKSKLIMGNNTIDKWCLSNASLKIDSQGNGLIVKIDGQKSRKIDGAVTLVMAYEMFRRHRTEFVRNVEAQ